MREVMTIIYYAAGARVLEHLEPAQEWVLDWYPSAHRGAPLADARTPLVYTRAATV